MVVWSAGLYTSSRARSGWTARAADLPPTVNLAYEGRVDITDLTKMVLIFEAIEAL